MNKTIFILTVFLLGVNGIYGHECNHLIQYTTLKFHKADYVLYAKILKNYKNENEVFDQKWELEIINIFKGERVDTFKTTTKRLCPTSWFREGDFVILYGEKGNEKNVAYGTSGLVNRIVNHKEKSKHVQRKFSQEQNEKKGKIELEKLKYLKQYLDLTEIRRYPPSIKIDSFYPNKTVRKLYKRPKRIPGYPRRMKLNYLPKGTVFGTDKNDYDDMTGLQAIHVKLEFEEYNRLIKIEYLNVYSKRQKKIINDFFKNGKWILLNPEKLESITLVDTIFILGEDRRIVPDF